VTVWVYIMFWAKTSPVSEASTDFGEMWPLIVLMSTRCRSSAGGPGGIRLFGGTVVVVVVDAVVVSVVGAWPARLVVVLEPGAAEGAEEHAASRIATRPSASASAGRVRVT